MWGWLCAIVKGIFAALFGVAADKIEEKVEQPKTISDANTPENIVEPLRHQLDDELRDKNGGR